MNRRRFLGRSVIAVASATGAATALTRFSSPASPARAIASDAWQAAPIASAPADAGPGRVERGAFRSAALGREMAFIAYLPPRYDAASARFPTLYMLHGGGGDIEEWMKIGLLSTADALIRAGTIDPLIVVLPEGDQEYWVDHVVDATTGANGEKWGTYTARDVVATIDARYRTLASASARAIGGLSMGAHGALQLALNFPNTWSIVGAHSPSLRPEGDAPTYLGTGAAFAARDPLALIQAKPDLARTYSWWIDSGDGDPWRAQSQQISDELDALGVAHEWHPFIGGHWVPYWSAHVSEYLTYYAGALASRTL